MIKLIVVFGTRPEAIKMCPLVKVLKKQKEIQAITAVTGQHREMLEQVLDCFGITPDYNLYVMKPGQDLFYITEEVLRGMKEIYKKEKPDMVLVHGDTSTAFASALAAYYMDIPIGHVEAGLRTYNNRSPYPEEFNRQAIGSIATLHFAPTEQAKRNLLKEHKNAGDVYVTGNTVIDALSTTVQSNYLHPVIEWARGSRLVMLTAHRRENIGEGMEHIFSAVRRCVEEHEDVKLVYPVHLNPSVRETAESIFSGMDRIKLIEPMSVLDFHNVMKASVLILTDSGGIQEEAPALGKPVLVLRDTTERPEGVEAGTLKLIGTDRDNVYREITRVLDDQEEYQKMSCAVNPYGDGKASERITKIIIERFHGRWYQEEERG